MDIPPLFVDLALAAVAAFAGGIVARRLGLPVILGYLLAGCLIGPSTPGPVVDLHSVEALAEMGVAFLMFGLGAELSLARLRRLGRVAAFGGTLQILGTIALGVAIGPWLGLGLDLPGSVFLGGLLALSSTVVALKLLMSRGELPTPHGQAALGILIAQDLALVPLVIVLPALASGSDGIAQELGLAALKAGIILLGAYLAGVRLVPWLLGRAAVAGSRELFLIGSVGLALGTALVTQAVGLSPAFGAFLAGVVVAESEYHTQVLAETLPLRDLFGALFFVSVGMLIDPLRFFTEAGAVALLLAATLVGKALIGAASAMVLGLPRGSALLTGLSLAQIGEFSFVLGRIGVDAGAIPPALFDLTLKTALASIVIAPFLVRAGPVLARLTEGAPLPHRHVPVGVGTGSADEPRDHVVLCGFGRLGREVAEVLTERGVPFLVVELDPQIVRELRAEGIPTVFGDAGNPVVLDHTGLERARLLAVLINDADAAELATRSARQRFPDLDIVVRTRDHQQVERLWAAGATEVVQPEFEASLEVIRHVLLGYGADADDLADLVDRRRRTFYRSAKEV